MNFIDGPARAEAFKMRQEGAPLRCPFIIESTFVEPRTPETKELTNNNKPEFYARFSDLIDSLMCGAYAPNTPLGLQMGDYVIRPEQVPTVTMLQHHWYHSLSRHLLEKIETQLHDETYKLLGQCATARNRLTGKTYADPLEALLGGLDTSTKIICGHIGGMAEFSRQKHGDANSAERTKTIGKSTGPILSSINTSTSRLNAFTNLHMPRGVFGAHLYSEHPKNEAIDLALPFNEHTGILHEQLVRLEDITEDEPIIGCPIILTPQQAQNMWRWGVAMSAKCKLI